MFTLQKKCQLPGSAIHTCGFERRYFCAMEKVTKKMVWCGAGPYGVGWCGAMVVEIGLTCSFTGV